jgi:phosphoenolpyruvate carboxylase
LKSTFGFKVAKVYRLGMNHLPQDLRELVRQSVEILGDVIQREIGAEGFARVEKIRSVMATLRPLNRDQAYPILQEQLELMRGLSRTQRLDLARAFTLMLEMMNACEDAYRSHRIAERDLKFTDERPDSVIYVLTAHPTEARSPANIEIFHQILLLLIPVFRRLNSVLSQSERDSLKHGLEMAWQASIVREKKPRVADEADHIYSTLLREETLSTLLKVSRDLAPIYIRSWVGGDKDGHPGVDEVAFLESLGKSRTKIINFCRVRLKAVEADLHRIHEKVLLFQLREIEQEIQALRMMAPGDAKQVVRVRKLTKALIESYEKKFGVLHPRLRELKSLFHMFPALVVPLELREASDVLISDPSGKSLAIVRMLKALKKLSGVNDPRWYVRGFIVSMTSELSHLEAAAAFVEKVFGSLRLPVIPLFEQSSALLRSEEIIEKLIKSVKLGKALRTLWKNQLEMMLGYSDSSKESGVLRSRVQVAETMHRLDHLCRRLKVTPVFFQGSGGSTDRGGGSIEEQTSWWPAGALRNYKVTVQGEMVERSLASPEITRGQLEKIVQLSAPWREAESRHLYASEGLNEFADKVASVYQATVHDDAFLEMIGQATPYLFLDLLRIGSRPTKRTTSISVEGLRAIPWVLCWTQTRTLFPTWWGVGSVWEQATDTQKKVMLEACAKSPVVASYVKALGYTLAKVRLSIFRIYLEESALPRESKDAVWNKFCDEYDRTLLFVKAALGSDDLISWRPWLEDSIHLRSPMIHPLNLLQVLAMKDHDDALLRLTVTGISSGMMTTG